jgi:hypothetical protein
VPAKQQIINVLPIQVAKQNELSANGTGKGAKTPQHAQKLQQSELASEHRLKRACRDVGAGHDH